MQYIAASIAIIASAFGAAFGNSKVVSTALESIARQPEVAGDVRSTMILGMAFVEAVPILGVVVALLMVL